MRLLVDILMLTLGLSVLLAIGRGLPTFAMLLRHPVLWLLLASLIALVLWRRRKVPRA